ncbi:MAG: hypothetical protein QOF71_1583 [Candidatus Eremiobacteraeota bacterium]|nr:hypothetical protein [Candidatus Eremiobacteraeota bacterium]
MLASALLLTAGAAARVPAVAADDPQLVQLHSGCHYALDVETRASRGLKSQNASWDDATRTLKLVREGLDWNEKACGAIAGRSAQENAVRRQMHDVNEAFLLSLAAQAQSVAGYTGEAASTYARANSELSACAAAANLPANQRANCRVQIANNRASQNPGPASPTDPCQVGLVAANDAGEALKLKDYASFEKAYFRATAGLAANKGCTRSPQMHDVTNAYLLTWKTVADRYLDVPFRTDRDIANPADPFATANDLLRKCAGWGAPFPVQAKADCASQLATNQRFLSDYAAQPPMSPGQTTQPLTWQQIDWPYPLRPDFIWDAPCKNNENARCADEEVRDGSGPNGWGSAPSGVATQLDDQRERVLFATIRNCDDLHRLFGGQPPQFACDSFKSNIVLVAAQRKPHQQCDMAVDRVLSVSSPSAVNVARDAVRVNYSLTCAAPVAGSSGGLITKVVSIPRSNAHGEFATVTFEELGGGGPRGGT